MTCYNSHGYTEVRKKGVKVNGGGVVVVQGVETGLWRRTDRSEFTQAYLNPNLCSSPSVLTLHTTMSCGEACLFGHPPTNTDVKKNKKNKTSLLSSILWLSDLQWS